MTRRKLSRSIVSTYESASVVISFPFLMFRPPQQKIMSRFAPLAWLWREAWSDCGQLSDGPNLRHVVLSHGSGQVEDR